VVGAGVLAGTGAWQVLIELPPDSPLAHEPASLELFQRLFRERTGRADLELHEASWLSHFRFNRRMVDRYRVGRVFVAGDAAHVHSPAGGQGMNTGVQDAYNLGWKLAAVLQGKAPEALLDSYERERRPVAAAVLKGSSQGHDAIFSDQPLMTLLRERVLLPLLSLRPVKGALARSMAQLGTNYRGSPLALEPIPWRPLPALLPDGANEEAGLGDRLSFQQGPRAGDRAPDACGLSPDGFPLRLFDRLRGPHWSLLLFDGRGQTPAGYARLRTVASEAEALLGHEEAYGVALDAQGNIYLTGRTYSDNFPGTGGARATGRDIFVTKLDPTGRQVIYSTLIGGRNSDDGVAIAVTAAGEAVVAAYTTSDNFPLKSPALGTLPASSGALLKLTPAGAIAWSTYLDAEMYGAHRNLGLDQAGNVYVTGARDGDVVVTKFSPAGALLGERTALSDGDPAQLSPLDAPAREAHFVEHLGAPARLRSPAGAVHSPWDRSAISSFSEPQPIWRTVCLSRAPSRP